MNKKLKKFLITMLIIVLTAGVGVGGYFLINSLSSVTIYNLTILNSEGNPIKDTATYLTNKKENMFYIDVDIKTSTGSTACVFTSSDPSVATVKNDGSFYVEYYKPGKTTISVYSTYGKAVSDSFVLDVYENYVNSIIIDESADNTLTLYGDGTSYTYSYEAFGNIDGIDCNNLLIEVVDSYNKEVINDITINTNNKTITIDSNLVANDSNEVFYLQTYYVDAENVKHIVDNFAYTINVVGYRLVDMQLLISQDYEFSKGTYVVLPNGSIFVEGETYLKENETIVPELMLCGNVTDLYFKIRVVYSNKTSYDVSYEANLNLSLDNSKLETYGGESRYMNYWRVYLKDSVSVLENFSANLSISYQDQAAGVMSSIEKQFVIPYILEETSDITDTAYETFVNNSLYAKVYATAADQVAGTISHYKYIYWDTRFRRTDTITDEKGNIVGFIDAAPTCNQTIILEPSN